MPSTAWMRGVVFLLFLSGCAVPAAVRRESPTPKPPAPVPSPAERPVLDAPVIVKPAPPVPSRVEGPPEDPFAAFPGIFRAKALAEERQGDPRTALLHWRVVRAFLPEDPEAVGRVTALERELRSAADGHLRKGKERYQDGMYEEARRELLAALALDPFLEEAAVYLKQRLVRQDSRTYVTREGDTPTSVAREIYGDPGKDFLVAYFNGLDAGTPLRAGTKLVVPLLDIPVAGAARAPSRANAPVPSLAPAPAPPTGPSPARTLARPGNPDDSLDRGRASFRSGEYKQAAALAEQVLGKSPTSREARDLRNAAYYQLGTEYLRRQEYPESLRMFQKVETSYKDQKAMVARVESRLREEAESHYAAGVKRFLAEDLEDAAKEWEMTLKLNPSHPKARKDLERARRLLEQVRAMP